MPCESEQGIIALSRRQGIICFLIPSLKAYSIALGVLELLSQAVTNFLKNTGPNPFYISSMATTIVPSVIVNLEVLSQDNYEDWSFRVKTYLLAERLWKIVEVTTEPPKLEEDEDKFDAWSERNAKALHTIHISCGHNAYAFIKGISMAKVAWDILADKFKPTEVSHNADVRSDLRTKQTPIDGDAGPKKDMEIETVGDMGFDLHPKQTPADGYVGPKIDMEIETVEEGESMNGNLIYEPFFKNVEDRKWDAVMEFIRIHPEAVRARHPSNGRTALYKAVRAEEVETVKELVQLMTVEDLEMKDNDGDTALTYATLIGKDTDKMVDIVKCLVEKNKKLLTLLNAGNDIPLLTAFNLQKWKMATYIYSITPLETLNDRDAASLISLGVAHKCLDISLDLIWHKPSLGITKDHIDRSPLFKLADTSSAFLSGSRLRFWEQWIYHCMHVEPTRTMDFKKEPITNINDICIDVQTLERYQGNQRHLNICSGICNAVGHFFRELLVTNLFTLVGINRIYQMKLFHVQALEILHRICEVLKTKDVKDLQHDDSFVSAIFRAVQLGQVEFMTHIFKANPRFKDITDVRDRSLFQFAAECRQEKIYSFIYGLDEQMQKYFVGRKDKDGNNMLHTIGGFSSFAQIDHIQGAALQMQRELQWFKEVESTIRQHKREATNHNHITPRELFTKNHIDLVKEGEKSMKETATSCTVVGALIVTIMFAAAFTVPGGNDERSGFPKFLDQKEFKIFIASDAISLFFSTTSVMIFLGMLTSRYAQNDFLISLPRKMILGLLTLFVSIAAMMVAFSSALFLMVPGESWIAFPAILLSTIPIASFVWMQFPLLADIIIYTYGSVVFDKKVQP